MCVFARVCPFPQNQYAINSSSPAGVREWLRFNVSPDQYPLNNSFTRTTPENVSAVLEQMSDMVLYGRYHRHLGNSTGYPLSLC